MNPIFNPFNPSSLSSMPQFAMLSIVTRSCPSCSFMKGNVLLTPYANIM